MSYIDKLNLFYDLLQSNPPSQHAQLLYHTLLMVNNKCGWMEWFQRTNLNLCGITGISEKTLINARNELKQMGLIDFIPSKKRNEKTKYKILDCKIDGTKSSLCSSPYSSPNAVQPPVQSPDINRLKTKTKNKKDTTYLKKFEEFWILYPRKVAKAAALKAFEKNVTDDLFPVILSVLEKQRQSSDWLKDDGKFIPYPATWLNGKRWEDQITVENYRQESKQSRVDYSDLSRYDDSEDDDIP